MKNFLLLSIFYLLGNYWCSAQNLVSNPGFESLSSPVTGEGQIVLASPWTSAGGGTPDLFSSGFSGIPPNPCDAVGIPLNMGGFAPSTAGTGYAGISVDFINGYYEYLQIPLTIPLQSGDRYKVELDILKADSSQYSCNRIGVLFSNNAIVQTGTGLMGFTPHMENSGAAVINDTTNWTHLTFTPGFYVASGGENYITIGVFRSGTDPALTLQSTGPVSSGCSNTSGSAYYYIDNVVVAPDQEFVIITTGDTVVCPNETTILTANSNVPIWWSDQSNPSDTLSTHIDFPANPPGVNTTYYLNGQTLIDSITIYVVNPPVFDIGPDTTFCEGDTLTLNAFAPDGILYTWSNGDTAAATTVTDTGIYWVIVDNLGCGVFDSIHFHSILPNPPVDLGLDSTYCFFENDTLFLDAGSSGIAYSWIPFGETTQIIKVLTPAYYQVTVTRPNGCNRRAGFEVLEVCKPKIFIPSAFTPDGDGLNDVFIARVNSVTQYSLQVYTRGGKLVFSSGNLGVGWDGTYNGKEVPAGVYTYRLFYAGYNDDGEEERAKFIDTVTLIR